MENGEWRIEKAGSPKNRQIFWGAKGEWKIENGEWRIENGELILNFEF